jgi:hypothetical protein
VMAIYATALAVVAIIYMVDISRVLAAAAA